MHMVLIHPCRGIIVYFSIALAIIIAGLNADANDFYYENNRHQLNCTVSNLAQNILGNEACKCPGNFSYLLNITAGEQEYFTTNCTNELIQYNSLRIGGFKNCSWDYSINVTTGNKTFIATEKNDKNISLSIFSEKLIGILDSARLKSSLENSSNFINSSKDEFNLCEGCNIKNFSSVLKLENGSFHLSLNLTDDWGNGHLGVEVTQYGFKIRGNNSNFTLNLTTDKTHKIYSDKNVSMIWISLDFENTVYAESSIIAEVIADKHIYHPLEKATFLINITNTGNYTLDPTGIRDNLPAGIRYLWASVTPTDLIKLSNNSTSIIWDNIGPIAPSESKIIEMTGEVERNSQEYLTNVVTVTGTPENTCFNLSTSAVVDLAVLSDEADTESIEMDSESIKLGNQFSQGFGESNAINFIRITST